MIYIYINQAGVSRHVLKNSEQQKKHISIQAVQLLLTARSMARVALHTVPRVASTHQAVNG